MITNSWQKYHKIILHAPKSHGIELERKLYKKLRQNAQETSQKCTRTFISRRQIGTYIFLSILTCNIIIKLPNKYQETYDNFLGIFCKKFGMHMDSISKKRGAIINKKPKKRKKAKGPRIHGPNPRIWWIRIKLTLQERWIDPDPSGSESNGWEREKNGSGLGWPGSNTYIKGVWPVFLHFLKRFSFFFSSPSPFSLLHTKP